MAAKIIPLRKTLDFGGNIQKLDMTKKKRQTPKNVLSGERACADFAL